MTSTSRKTYYLKSYLSYHCQMCSGLIIDLNQLSLILTNMDLFFFSELFLLFLQRSGINDQLSGANSSFASPNFNDWTYS